MSKKCTKDLVDSATWVSVTNSAAIFEDKYGSEAAKALMRIVNFIVTCTCRTCVGLPEK